MSQAYDVSLYSFTRRVYDARLHIKLLVGFVREKFMYHVLSSSEVKSFASLQDLLVLEHSALYFLRSFVFNIWKHHNPIHLQSGFYS